MDQFFVLSKVFWFFAAPSNLLAILAAAGGALLVLAGRGRAVLLASVAGLLVFGFSPVANHIIAPLEDRFPQFVDDGQPVDGILLLGGAEVADLGLLRGVPAFNDAGERAMAFADLARRYPGAKLVFVGGGGTLTGEEGNEAKMMRASLPMLGIPPGRVVLEKRSRNTWENALFAKALVDPRPGERWLLVTSAMHMPRAIGCFRKVGFDVTAYPVDYRTAGPAYLNATFSRAAIGLDFTDGGVKEWVGLLVYYLTGKTDALFPAP